MEEHQLEVGIGPSSSPAGVQDDDNIVKVQLQEVHLGVSVWLQNLAGFIIKSVKPEVEVLLGWEVAPVFEK